MKFVVVHIWPEHLGGNATIMADLYNTFEDASKAAHKYEKYEKELNRKSEHKYCATALSITAEELAR